MTLKIKSRSPKSNKIKLLSKIHRKDKSVTVLKNYKESDNYNSIDPLTLLFLKQQHLMNMNIHAKYVKIPNNINQDMQKKR